MTIQQANQYFAALPDGFADPAQLGALLPASVQQVQFVGVAGTAGKTAVARLLAAILHAQGIRAGVYHAGCEPLAARIRVDGKPVDEALLCRAADALAAHEELPLQAADPLLLETALHSLVAPVRDAEEKYVQLLCAVVRQGSGAVQLTGQVRFCAGNGCLRQEMLPDALPRQLESAPQQVPLLPEKQPEFRLRGGWKGKAELLTADFEKKIQVVHKKDLKNRADYARITTLYTGLVLRARQPGDRFRPAGRGLSKPLRKWMNEAGVPNELRDTLPLLASGSEILWVCGEGFADGLAPDTESRWILHLNAEIETQEEKTNEYAR